MELQYRPTITVEKSEGVAEYDACRYPGSDRLGESPPTCIGEKGPEQPNCKYLCGLGRTCATENDCGTGLCANVDADHSDGEGHRDPDGDGKKMVCVSGTMSSLVAPVVAFVVAAAAFF